MNTVEMNTQETPTAGQPGLGIRGALGWGFSAVQLAAPVLGKCEAVAGVVSPNTIEIAGKAASIGNSGIALEAHAKQLMKDDNTTAENVGTGVGMVSTALGVAAVAGEILSPYVPAVTPFIPYVGQAATVLGYAGMAYNAGHAVYKAVS